jgi:transcriptional regulator of acetoin/glycerol metabolism
MKTLSQVLAETRHVYLAALLIQTQGNLTEAARLAGISRATFYRFMGARKPRPMNHGNELWRSLRH